jgi:hypothetical protein
MVRYIIKGKNLEYGNFSNDEKGFGEDSSRTL